MFEEERMRNALVLQAAATLFCCMIKAQQGDEGPLPENWLERFRELFESLKGLV